MTNAEYYEKLEDLAEQTMVLIEDCHQNWTRIDETRWDRLCKLYRELADYIP